MVRVLAKELGFTVLEWEDANNSSCTTTTTTTTENGAFFTLPPLQQSQLNSFQEFLFSSGGGFQTLSIVENDNVNSFSANEQKFCNHRPLILIEEVMRILRLYL
jgi:hypothetical protein